MPEAPTRVRRAHMSQQQYFDLPEGVRAEYVDGEVIVTPPASSGHNKTQRRLANLIETSLVAHLDVVTDAGWRSGDRLRVPDVAVFARREDTVFYDQTPLLVVEVLSPSTRGEDTLRKSGEYARAGVGQYWILDREHRTLTVLANTGRESGGGWDVELELDDDRPTGRVVVGAHGEVPLDLTALLAP